MASRDYKIGNPLIDTDQICNGVNDMLESHTFSPSPTFRLVLEILLCQGPGLKRLGSKSPDRQKAGHARADSDVSKV